MKIALALWIAYALCFAGGCRTRLAMQQSPDASFAHEQFEFGFLSLDFRLRNSGHNGAGESAWTPNQIRVNTDVSASLAPFALRIAVVLKVGGGPPRSEAGALMYPNDKGSLRTESLCWS